ncbi:hypothetical protein Cgig2_024233 [Carnegiea gigantea]|uniref:Uncharacterized protein n=1 Tax=Carnegiea gigantea TaxID=171969 RepID=A0A9Q1QAR3_9CARY|nr:hypothetical protein Cgig2_024233 [Carnegiea gigantea]
MADAITRQVSEEVRRAMEVAGTANPILPLEYPFAREGEPSHCLEEMLSLRPMEHSREVARSERSDRLPTGRHEGREAMELIGRSARETIAVLATASTHYAKHSRRTAWLEEREQTSRPGYITNECRELKKALHELPDKGQIDRFLKRGPRFL